VLIETRVMRYQPACHSCCHPEIVFKFMAAKVMIPRWKRMVTAGNPTVINSLNIITIGVGSLARELHAM
jgi:hypothetical protein